MTRSGSLGESRPLGPVDKLGIWLSFRKLRRSVGDVRGKRIGDFGCGFDAHVARRFLGEAGTVLLVDLSLNETLGTIDHIRPIEGYLPDVMSKVEDESLDVALFVSVLEHLDEPERMLRELHRVLAPNGVLFVNVPSWLGRRALEFAAFRLKVAPFEEMDDHKRYYDTNELWPLLVAAGFRPHAIRCKRYKFGLNTYALCRKAG